MTSPERPKNDPKSPVVQESPVFTYLSNLSPLKPVQSRSGVQPYADTSCPTPDPVFKSPHFTRPRDPRLLKRLSDAEKVTSRPDDEVMAALPEDMVIVPYVAQMFQLVPCVMQRWSDDGPSEDQHCESPTTCVDTFFADSLDNSDVQPGFAEHIVNGVSLLPVQDVQVDIGSSKDDQTECQNAGLVQDNHTSDSMKSVTSTGLPDVNADQVAAVSQDLRSDISSTEGSTSELLVPNIKTPHNTTDSLSSSSLNGTEMVMFEEGPSFLVDMVETENNVKNVDKALEATGTSPAVQLNPMPENVSIKADSDTVLSSEEQYDCISVDHKGKRIDASVCSHGSVYLADNIQRNQSDYVPQLQPEPLQNSKAGIILLDDTRVNSCATAENHIPCDQEDCADHPRGMRKRLQFEVVESCQMSSDYQTDSWVFTNDVSNVESPVTSLGMEPVNVSNKESLATSGDKQLNQSVSGSSLCRHSCKIDSSAQNTGSPPVSVPKALSIGLHLNSIGGPTNINVNIPLPENCLGVQGDKFLSASNSQVSQYPIDHLSSRSLTRSPVKSGLSSDIFPYYSVAENSEEKLQEIETILVPNSTHQSSLSINPLSSSMQLKPIDHHITPCSMKKRLSECANSTESTQRSPTKKMKRAAEKEICKRCNCKRSKCLKLYCECFASGVFCSEACACHDCYNKPEHEDTVQQTRQQIESRNPLAFVPKVVVRVTNHSKNTGDSGRVTPNSARHKRGCNCKKSMCLKKYCECFQAGVGCSLGCRCDSCRNSFGMKGGGNEIYETEPKSPKLAGLERGPTIGNLEGIKVKKAFPNNESCYSRLSPLTPQVQGTNGNDGDKFQVPAKYYPFRETGVSVSPPYEESPSSPTDTISSNIFAKEIGLGYHTTVHEDFSPGWEGFPDICNFSPLSNISPQVSGASSSLQTREPKTFHAKLFHGNVHLPVGPHCWHTSPVTPMPQMGESKFVIDPLSHSGSHNNHEDDTPEILKDSSSPIKVVNASSPSKKRVSPPHKHFHGMASSSSPNLRSGRKFILQSVPAFPPLTPYHKNNRENGT